MSGFIPREKLTAYQRWELAAFDEEEQTAESPENAAPPPQSVDTPMPPEAPEPEPLVLPTVADIERMHDEAREQGYAAGHAAGHSDGYAAGQTEGLDKARETAAQLAEILQSVEQAVGEIEQRVAEQLLATAVEIASQVLRQSLRVKPELILPVVREAVDALQFNSGHPALLAHPDDAALIREHLGDRLAHNNWRIIEDPSLTRGGCRAELSASEVDATMETRWRRVIETLGVSHDWLETTPEGDGPHDR